MNSWGQSCQAVNQSLQSAVDAMGDLTTCFRRDIEGKNRVPAATARQMRKSLAGLGDALNKLALSVSGVADAHSQAVLSFLAGRRLDREQFYILLATECVEWTNKNVGLSDFDDYELFDMLRYEGSDRTGYIYLASDIDDLPDIGPDDWALGFLSRTYRRAIIPPEDIEWDRLSPRQRWFFQKHLPDSVLRFIHENPANSRPSQSASRADSAKATNATTAKVGVQELISALKSLKAHHKARRHMDLLIRNGDREGELVLQLSGRSQYAGIMTTVKCTGRCELQALAPVGSLRGLVNYPPDEQTVEISFREGRLRIGSWSCPARKADID